jgi:hypothetical protein
MSKQKSKSMKMDHKLLAALLVLVLVLQTVTLVSSKGKYYKEKNQTPQMLYVQNAESGNLVGGDSDVSTLTLTGVDADTIYFSDRPFRVTGTETTEKFAAEWSEGGDSFLKNPPNAALVLKDANENEDTLLVELLSLEYTAATQTAVYKVRMLEQPTKALSELHKSVDLDIADRFGSASLFIDSRGSICVPNPVCISWDV